MAIDLTEADRTLVNEIIELGGEDILKCFQCGTCVADCPAATAEIPLRIKKLIHMIHLGLRDELLEEDSVWMCVTCTACEERCPRGVKPFEVCLAIRRWQAKEDPTYIPPALGEIFKTGHTQNVANVPELRKSLGLEEVPPTVAKFPELLKKFQEMLKCSKIVQEYGFMFGVG